MAKKFWFAVAVEILLIALLPRYGDLSLPGNPLKFVALYLAAGVAYWAALRAFGTVTKAHRPKVFWLVALALRLAIFPMSPADDMWRYLWEAKVQQHGFNPYTDSPQSEKLVLLRDEIWPKINHPEWSAIYPPATEMLFALMARVSTSPIFFKAIFTLADLLVCFLLLRMNTGPGRYRLTAWFAWNPLVVSAFAGAGHFDSLLLLAMTAALWSLHRARPSDTGVPAWSWAVTSGLFLGLAIAIKTVPVFLVPVWFIALRWRGLVVLLSGAVPWLLALPFGGLKITGAALAQFVNVSRFNDLVWWMFDLWLWPASVKQIVTKCWFYVLPLVGLNPYYENSRGTFLIALVVAVLAVCFRHDWRRAALWFVGALLVLSPVLHPWYVTWILPLACWRKQSVWFVLAMSAALCLLVWEAGPFWGAWQMTPALHLLVIAPPLLALFLKFKKAGTPAFK